MGVNNNICTALNNLYSNLLSFIDMFSFNEQQEKIIQNIKFNLELALPRGKFVTSKLEEFKRKDDPTYNNQSDFFQKDKSYIEEMIIEAEKLKNSYKDYKIKNIDENEFFNEINSDGLKKYQLIKNYEEVYNLALILNDTLNEEQKSKFEEVIKRILNCFYMSYRMCRKLNDYRKKYPFDGDEGKYWLKDQKMSTIEKSARRFKKINEERFERKKSDDN